MEILFNTMRREIKRLCCRIKMAKRMDCLQNGFLLELFAQSGNFPMDNSLAMGKIQPSFYMMKNIACAKSLISEKENRLACIRVIMKMAKKFTASNIKMASK